MRGERVARTSRKGLSAAQALERHLPSCDVLVLLLPLTPSTRGMIDRRPLATLPEGAMVVDAGRGAVLDTSALADELQAGWLRAALDVTDPEPLSPVHPVWDAPNTILTPHVASATPETRKRAYGFARQQILRYVRGDSLENAVTDEY